MHAKQNQAGRKIIYGDCIYTPKMNCAPRLFLHFKKRSPDPRIQSHAADLR